MAKKYLGTLFGGDWQKVLIRVVLLLLVLLLIYYGVKKLISLSKTKKTREEKEDIIQDIIDNPPVTTDNTMSGDPETITDVEALDIANKLQQAMSGWGTDLDLMVNLLSCLNGASLVKVKIEFGVRDYDGDSSKPYDLFDWFGEELEANPFGNVGVNSDCVPNCESFFDFCGEAYFMRQIWNRTGLLVTF